MTQARRTYWHTPDLDNSDDFECFCPLLMCYFAFSLDHVASVDFLDDPEATCAARRIPSGTYVGLAEQVSGILYSLADPCTLTYPYP